MTRRSRAKKTRRPASRNETGRTAVSGGQPRTTLPAFRHEVQTVMRRRVPGATSARTFCTFGFHRRWVRRWECETDMPKPGPLPQRSQTLATVASLDCLLYTYDAA